jgi:hypothetical protein
MVQKLFKIKLAQLLSKEINDSEISISNPLQQMPIH